MQFKDKVVIVPGGAQGIGKCIADEFCKEGAHVCIIDKQEGKHFVGNMGMGAFNKLTMHGISVIRGCHGNIEDVLKAYLDGSISDSAESCSHHDCGSHEEMPVFVIPNIK